MLKMSIFPHVLLKRVIWSHFTQKMQPSDGCKRLEMFWKRFRKQLGENTKNYWHEENKHGDPTFFMATFIALYMTVNCVKFEKMWILHHFQGNYLKHATASIVKSNRNWFQTSDIVSPDWIRYFIFLQERHVP